MSLPPDAYDADRAAETGRRLGHDFFRWRCPPPGAALPASLREGYAEAQSRRRRTEIPDRHVRKWLQLRLGALRRGRAFDEQEVTPALLRGIDVAVCPVLRVPLTHGERQGTDWSVDRLNNDGAYARNNLAVMSVRANRAKGALSFDEVLARARSAAPTDGLQPAEWLRLAVLMLGPCFADRPRQAPCLPLVAAPPAGTLRLAMQQVQHVFTVQARTQAGKNQLVRHFRQASAEQRAEWRLRAFAEAVHVGLKGLAHDGDVWLQGGVMAALAQWREALGDRAWALAGEISRRLAGSRCLPAARLEGWHLATRGYAS